MDIGYRIITNINRPNQKIVNMFKYIPVANIADAMGRLYSLNSRIKPFNSSHLLGTAITVKSRTADNLLFQKALNIAVEGDVIVVDSQGDTLSAVAGEMMMEYAKGKKIAGFLIDGAVRDSGKIKVSSFPVFACGISPNGPHKSGPGEINVPISCGGVVINPGDIIIGDDDGVIAVQPNFAKQVFNKALKISKTEEIKLKEIKENKAEREWIDKILSNNINYQNQEKNNNNL